MKTDRMLRTQEVMEMTGMSRTSIWRLERDCLFPKKRRVGVRGVGYLLSEVTDYISSRPVVEIGSSFTD